ncbi:MAG: FtsL-like putative cell division protein [Bacteroidota bacterium]
MKNGLLDVLKGKFLVSGDAPKNWLFLVFISFLAVIMISSSHQADKKVTKISHLNEEVRAMRSEFVALRQELQQMRLESNVKEKIASKGLKPTPVPPQKILIKSTR